MSKNKVTLLAMSVLALAGTTVNASATAPTVSGGVKFTGFLKIGGVVSKNKTEISVSKYAQNSILAQSFRYDDNADHVMPLMAMDDTQIDECQAADGSDASKSGSNHVLYDTNLASNVQKIISNRYASGGNGKFTKVKAYQDDLATGVNSISGMNIGLSADLGLGLKIDRFSFGFVGSLDMPMKGKTATASWSKETATTDKSSSTSASSSSSSSNSNNKSKTGTTLDVTVKSKLGFGAGLAISYAINRCFSIGAEGGWKRYSCEADVTNLNVNLLGVTGTPKYTDAKKIKAENCSDTAALKGARSDKGVDKLTGTMNVVYAALTFGYNINRYLGVFAALGVQSGGELTLKDGKTKITNPDFVIKKKMGMFAKLGASITF